MGDSTLDRLRARTSARACVVFPKGGLLLHAMVTSAGYDRCTDPAYDWRGLQREGGPFVLLQHTISGRGWLSFESRRLEVREGQTMLLRFPHDNRYWLGHNPFWEFFWLALNGREVQRIWREVMAAHGPLVRLPPPAVEALAGNCISVLDGAAATAPRASALAYQAAMCLAEELLPRVLAMPGTHSAAIERTISFCHAHAADPRLDVGRLATSAGYSRHHFSRLFTESVGTSPGRYLLRLRLDEAARQLRASDLPVKQVAIRCGFGDPNYFAKAFRRVFGMSPRDIRRADNFSKILPRSEV